MAVAVENRCADFGGGCRGRCLRRLAVRGVGPWPDTRHGFDCRPTGYRCNDRPACPGACRPIGRTGCAATRARRAATAAGSTTSRGGGCADHRRGRCASGPATRSTATRGYSASACAQLRSASAPAATAASRPDHRTHPDHRSVPPAEPVRVISGASCRAR
jgi:hypothetical protein